MMRSMVYIIVEGEIYMKVIHTEMKVVGSKDLNEQVKAELQIPDPTDVCRTNYDVKEKKQDTDGE